MQQLVKCEKCGTEVPADRACKVCSTIERHRIWSRLIARRMKYGVSVRSLNRMYEDQGGRCAVCKVAELTSSDQRWVQPDRDGEGRVMALLCNPCHKVLQALARWGGDGPVLIRYWMKRPLRHVVGPVEAKRLRHGRGAGTVRAMMKEQGL